MIGLLGIPIFGLLVILQTAVVSRLPLLYGTADIVLLTLVAWSLQERVTTAWAWAIIAGVMVSFVSALPFYSPLIGYLAVTLVARILQRHVWQTPILAMFVATFIGTLLMHSLSIVVLRFSGDPLPIQESLNLITLPSALLNLVLAIPVYAVVKDLSGMLYPMELEV